MGIKKNKDLKEDAGNLRREKICPLLCVANNWPWTVALTVEAKRNVIQLCNFTSGSRIASARRPPGNVGHIPNLTRSQKACMVAFQTQRPEVTTKV